MKLKLPTTSQFLKRKIGELIVRFLIETLFWRYVDRQNQELDRSDSELQIIMEWINLKLLASHRSPQRSQ